MVGGDLVEMVFVKDKVGGRAGDVLGGFFADFGTLQVDIPRRRIWIKREVRHIPDLLTSMKGVKFGTARAMAKANSSMPSIAAADDCDTVCTRGRRGPNKCGLTSGQKESGFVPLSCSPSSPHFLHISHIIGGNLAPLTFFENGLLPHRRRHPRWLQRALSF